MVDQAKIMRMPEKTGIILVCCSKQYAKKKSQNKTSWNPCHCLGIPPVPIQSESITCGDPLQEGLLNKRLQPYFFISSQRIKLLSTRWEN